MWTPWIGPCILLCSLVVPSSVLPAAGAREQASGETAQAVDRLFAEWTDPDSPGAAVAVVRNGRMVLSRAYGLANLEYRIPVTPATPFDIMSMTKQFTAFAVAMLVEQGKLSPDDDVRKYIPEMRAGGGAIRIKHLLSHTSGLRDEFNLLTLQGFGLEDAITPEHTLRLITTQEELLFEPGQRWEYCNSGYTLLAEIISRVTGKPYAAWLKENVVDPLGMTRTGLPTRREPFCRAGPIRTLGVPATGARRSSAN